MPRAVTNQPTAANGRVLSIKNLLPSRSMYMQLVSVPKAFTAAKGIFSSSADSSVSIPEIVRPA